MKERGKERAGKLIQLLKTISSKKVGDSWSQSEAPFINHLMFSCWFFGAYRVLELGNRHLVRIKNFGVNLTKLMLRNKEKHREYFEENQNGENVLNELLEKIEKAMTEHRET